jgi:hypothetical protein
MAGRGAGERGSGGAGAFFIFHFSFVINRAAGNELAYEKWNMKNGI